MENKRFLTANDVAEYMGISVPMAYKIIRRLNDELVAEGSSMSCPITYSISGSLKPRMCKCVPKLRRNNCLCSQSGRPLLF